MSDQELVHAPSPLHLAGDERNERSSPVRLMLEVRRDDEMPIVLAAFNYFDAFLRQRIFTFQQRYQQLRSGATPAGPLDLSADEILIILRRMQEHGRGLQAMCLRLGIDLTDEPQKAAHGTAREPNTPKYSPNQHHPSPSASAGGDGEEHQRD